MPTLSPQVFNFRNPQANVIKGNEADGLPAPIKRAAVTVEIPFLTTEEVIAILSGDNLAAKQLIVEQVNSVLVAEVRGQLDDLNNYEEVDLSLLDMAKVDFITLANLPPSIRTGGGISEELWNEWTNDMQEVITVATDRTTAQVTVVCTLFTKKLKEVSREEKVLRALENYLNIWFTNTSEASQEKFASIYSRLSARLETYLATVNDDPLAKLDI